MVKLIALVSGERALVDDEDYEYLNQWTWYLVKGWAKRYETIENAPKRMNRLQNRETISMHSMVAEIMNLNIPEGYERDHKDRNKLNNRRSNLRALTRSQNNLNKDAQVNNTSGVPGVSRVKKNGKWRAYIGSGYQQIYLGQFLTFDEAVAARKRAEKDYLPKE